MLWQPGKKRPGSRTVPVVALARNFPSGVMEPFPVLCAHAEMTHRLHLDLLPAARSRRFAAPGAVACLVAMAASIQAHAQTAAAPQAVTVVDIAARPLDDLNLRKDKAPTAPVLLAAKEHPYTLVGMGRCAAISREILSLNAALGPDIDAGLSPTEEQKRARAVGGTARALVGSLIPFDGVIRQISGANAAEAHRAVLLYAGSVRRAFLKGYGKAHGCRIKPAVPPGIEPQ